jgi:hypothetical protein
MNIPKFSKMPFLSVLHSYSVSPMLLGHIGTWQGVGGRDPVPLGPPRF